MTQLSSHMAYEILAYLTDHPRAQDTLAGIEEWWVLERCMQRARRRVKGAVDELVASGFLVADRGGDRRRRYRLDPARQSEARQLVERWDRDSGQESC